MRNVVVVAALVGVLLAANTASAVWHHRAVVAYYPAPVVVAPVVAAPVVVARPVYAPVVAPVPVVVARPVYQPIYAAPVVAPVAVPAPVVVARPVVVRQTVYYPGQPVRNVVRAVLP
ncbi:MAG: hypothetical protein ACOY3P_12635 [Planctomycetota bacterium]